MFIPDPTFFHPGSRIRTVSIPDPGSSKNLGILTPKSKKRWFLSSKKYDPGCSSRIPGSKRYPIPDPGSGSATLPSALKRGHPTLQNMNLKFLLLWVIFGLLDPDPDSESGSADPIESGSNPDPIRIRNPEKKPSKNCRFEPLENPNVKSLLESCNPKPHPMTAGHRTVISDSINLTRVADPDPGSGAFFTPGSG